MSRLTPPLTPSIFYLLLALAEGPLHGYALARLMEEESGGQVRKLPGNLYAVLRRLAGEGLVAETDDRPRVERDDRRRRYFVLTGPGRDVLEGEARRMARIAEVARVRLFGAGARDQETVP